MADRRDHTELFRDAKTGFTNALSNPDILDKLTPFEWGSAQLEGALELRGRAETLARTQTTEYQEQKAATVALGVAQRAARATYMRHLGIARTVYEPGDAAYETLGLGGERPGRMDDLLQEAARFYEAIEGDAAIQARLAQRTLNAEAVATGLAKLAAVDAAEEDQQEEMGEAQRATEVRDDEVEELEAQWGDFVEVATLALADWPQLREELGIFERS